MKLYGHLLQTYPRANTGSRIMWRIALLAFGAAVAFEIQSSCRNCSELCTVLCFGDYGSK